MLKPKPIHKMPQPKRNINRQINPQNLRSIPRPLFVAGTNIIRAKPGRKALVTLRDGRMLFGTIKVGQGKKVFIREFIPTLSDTGTIESLKPLKEQARPKNEEIIKATLFYLVIGK